MKRTSKLKMSAPSVKKGRRSWKKVSKAERFTCDGSASTCPKSGLMVAVSVRSLVSPYFTSAPTEPKPSFWFQKGSASDPGSRVTRATE